MSGLRILRAWAGVATSLVLLLTSISDTSVASAGVIPAAASPESGRAVSQPAHSSHSDSRHGPRGYVAMGDSYSSGQGTGIYFPSTDTNTPAANHCHRSPLASAPLLAARERRLRRLTFVACSAARTHDLYVANPVNAGEPAQLDALTKRTRAVSLTIGGNDIGFGAAVSACVQTPQTPAVAGFGCSTNAQLNSAVQAGTAALADLASFPDPSGKAITPITTVLADIHARAPRAKIYLAGYPELFGSRRKDFSVDRSAPSGYSCGVNSLIGARVDYTDAQWFLKNTHQLNAVLRRAVRQAKHAGVRATYVSPSTFDRHGLCDARTSWIQPLLVNQTLAVQSESLHPTPVGWVKGYARAFRRAGL